MQEGLAKLFFVWLFAVVMSLEKSSLSHSVFPVVASRQRARSDCFAGGVSPEGTAEVRNTRS